MREYAHKGFTNVECRHGIAVAVTKGPEYRVVLHANAVMQKKIAVELHGNTLRIRRLARFYFPPWTLDWKARVEIIAPVLENIHVSGGGRASLDLDSPAGLTARLSGGSTLAGRFNGKKLDLSAEGGSRVELGGSAASVTIGASGGSRLRLNELESATMDARLSGGSSLEATVKQSLSVTASGGSKVRAQGGARLVRQELSGGSSLRTE